ncbi:GIY-YIG nuclease family protein [Bacillus sp. AFS041924]|uniref:GIY-YIG nuclease family protein n=1 Tax=Bacillus sp. AFS041924 TaxID=2033503 RepID=UPI000BFB4D5D|nr:GIY-YIG nuclease family protein [Bacillus sp. AFS041924]PGS53855.1 hypothetical protein COC46_06540 [Bacillus sp. AFS041924]
MNSCYGLIYKATNECNGKIYIGITTRSLEERIIEHNSKALNGSRNIFHIVIYKNLQKLNKDNFDWEIIDFAQSKDDLLQKEVYWIRHYNSFVGFEECNGYNMTVGGEGFSIGEDNPQSQLNEKKVIKITKELMYGKTIKEVALSYDIAEHIIETISQGKTYQCYYTNNYKQWLKEKRDKEIFFIENILPGILKGLIRGKTHSDLAEKYQTNKSNITNISRGVSYKRYFTKEFSMWLRQKENESKVFLSEVLPSIMNDIISESYQQKELAKKYKVSIKSIQGILYEGYYKEHWSDEYKNWLKNKKRDEEIFLFETLPFIISEIMNGNKHNKIAQKFGVSYSTVKNISQGVAYRDYFPNEYTKWLENKKTDREQFVDLIPRIIKDIMNSLEFEKIANKYNLEIGQVQRISRGQVFRNHYTQEFISWLEEKENNKVTGISYKRKTEKWEAYITIDKKTKHLGTFPSKNDAIVARLKFEKECYGNDAPQRHLFNKFKI